MLVALNSVFQVVAFGALGWFYLSVLPGLARPAAGDPRRLALADRRPRWSCSSASRCSSVSSRGGWARSVGGERHTSSRSCRASGRGRSTACSSRSSCSSPSRATRSWPTRSTSPASPCRCSPTSPSCGAAASCSAAACGMTVRAHDDARVHRRRQQLRARHRRRDRHLRCHVRAGARGRRRPAHRGAGARGPRLCLARPPEEVSPCPAALTVPSVLFVCVHNAGRSQMAAAWLQRCPAAPSRCARPAARPPTRSTRPPSPRCSRSASTWRRGAQVLTTDAVRAPTCRHHGLRRHCPIFPGKRYEDWDSTTRRRAWMPSPIRDEIRTRRRPSRASARAVAARPSLMGAVSSGRPPEHPTGSCPNRDIS